MESIFNYSADEITVLLEGIGQPKFRARQLIQWLYQKAARSYDEMSNLPASLRARLHELAPLSPPDVVDRQVSRDGTRKYLLRLQDGCLVETVAIPSRDKGAGGMPRRLTVCFSTQVGCPMACSFCATGKEGFSRNLVPGEIVWQLLVCQQDMGMRVSNAVGMGQGEPFLNFDNVAAALHFINSPDGLGIGARHISVSTCGVLKGIERFSQMEEQFTLAVSLHCAIQEIRDELMPGCAGAPLDQLHEALLDYQVASRRRVSFEYLMIRDVTDTPECLDALIAFTRGLQSHVNLINVNEIEGSPYLPSTQERLEGFLSSLSSRGVETTIRDSRGSDIDGACGQLKNSRSRR